MTSETSEPLEITDLENLKALAHPRRQRILHYLGLNGPATSATLARALGLNTGATSYHLRELAKFGFVEERSERGRGRERWWQAPKRDLRVPPRTRQSEAMRSVIDEMLRSELADDFEQFVRLQAQRDDLGDWAEAFPHSRGSIRLTLGELREFFDDYIALLNRYKRSEEQTPPDARTVFTRFLAFPAPEQGAAGTGGDRMTD